MAAESRVHEALAPRVAVIASPDVDELCRANELANFADLLKPWETSVERVIVRTTQLESRQLPSFPLRIDDLRSLDAADERGPAGGGRPELVFDAVNARLRARVKEWDRSTPVLDIASVDDVDDALRQASLDELTPWFADFRDLTLRCGSISEHETFGHPVAYLLAISSNNPDPMNALAQLYDATTMPRLHSSRPFMDPNVFRYYVLVHDKRTSDAKDSIQLFESIKKVYGVHCGLLPLNSAEPTDVPPPQFSALWGDLLSKTRELVSAPETDSESGHAFVKEDKMYGRYLTGEDVRSVKAFLREMTAQSIIPFMERSVQQWNDQLASVRKGLTGRLFSAGRKYFGSSRSNSPAQAAPGYNPVQGFYPFAANEALTRRLADFAFMIRDYKLAAATYDVGRRDFTNDKAWKYAAGATEMFGLSHLLIMLTARTSPIDVDSYLSSALQLYAQSRSIPSVVGNNPLQLALHSVRATLLYYEAYHALEHYRSAPAALLRAASAADEVTSALLLEQAALADLRQKPRPSVRRYALHLVMAANRYDVCGQKELSRRCFTAAAALYWDRPWKLVRDHVHHSLGRQAYADGRISEAVEHMIMLLREERGEAERVRQKEYLNEFESALKYDAEVSASLASSSSLALPAPIFDAKRASIRLSDDYDDLYSTTRSADDSGWADLETAFLERGFKDRADGSERKRKRPLSLTPATSENIVGVGETFYLDLVARNPVHASVTLSDLTLLAFELDETGKPGPTVDASEIEGVELDAMPEVQLAPAEELPISFGVRCSSQRKIRFASIRFRFHDLLVFTETLTRKGRRLNATKAHRLEPTYAPDTSLQVSVMPPKPSIAITFTDAPELIAVGETVKAVMRVRNKGKVPLRDLRTLASLPTFVQMTDSLASSSADIYTSPLADGSTGSHDAYPSRSLVSCPNDLGKLPPSEIALPGEALQPDETVDVVVLLRGDAPGRHELRWLFVFESSEREGEYLSTRFAHELDVETLVEVSVTPQLSKSRSNAYSLALEVDNLHPTADVRIDQVSCLSPSWEISSRVTMLHNLSSVPPSQSSRTSFVLEAVDAPQEQQDASARPMTDLGFTVERLRSMLQGGNEFRKSLPAEAGVWISSVSTLSDPISTTAPWLRNYFLLSRRDWRQYVLGQQYPLIPAADHPYLFTLYEPRDVDVVVYFSIAGTDRRGHIHIFGLTLGPAWGVLDRVLAQQEGAGKGVRSMYEQTVREKAALLKSLVDSGLGNDEDCLAIDVDLVDEVRHDFQGEGPCPVPVTFTIRNTSAIRHARFVLALEGGPSELDSSLPPPALWQGRLTHRGAVAPGAVVEVRARALVERPATVSIGAWTLWTTVMTDGEGLKENDGGREVLLGKKIEFVRRGGGVHVLRVLQS